MLMIFASMGKNCNKRNKTDDLTVTLSGHQNLSWDEQCDKLSVHIVGKLSVQSSAVITRFNIVRYFINK